MKSYKQWRLTHMCYSNAGLLREIEMITERIRHLENLVQGRQYSDRAITIRNLRTRRLSAINQYNQNVDESERIEP